MSEKVVKMPHFKTNRVIISKGAKDNIPPEHISCSIQKHRTGDYGIVDLEGWDENVENCQAKKDEVIGCYEYINEENKIIYFNVSTSFAGKTTKVETCAEIEEDIDKILAMIIEKEAYNEKNDKRKR